MANLKRYRDSVSDDEDDLLRVLDVQRQREECVEWEKRSRLRQTLAATTATGVIAANRDSAHNSEASDDSLIDMREMTQLKSQRVDVDDDEDDLLRVLDVHRQREEWVEWKRRSRLRQKLAATTATGFIAVNSDSAHNNGVSDDSVKDMREMTQLKSQRGDVDGGGDGLLRVLDVQRQRGRWVEWKRRSRSRRKLVAATSTATGAIGVSNAVGEPVFCDERELLQSAEQDGTKPNTKNVLPPLTNDEQSACMKSLREALGADGLDESVCAVCDCLVLTRHTVRIDGSDSKYLGHLRVILGETDSDIPSQLMDQYEAPPHLPELEKVLISPRGIHCYIDESGFPQAWMSICKRCDRSISRGNLPKLAVANGFYVGTLPEHLRGLTIPERFMTQLTTMSAVTRVMRGGHHRCIRSHCVHLTALQGLRWRYYLDPSVT